MRVAHLIEDYLVYLFLGYLFWNSIPIFFQLTQLLYLSGLKTYPLQFCRWMILLLHNLANLLVLYFVMTRKPRVHDQTRWLNVILPILSFAWQALAGTWIRSHAAPSSIWIEALWPSLLIQLAAVILLLAGIRELSHCFAVTVEVRGHIKTGIYRYLRHPIYTSYLLQNISTLCLQPTSQTFIWCCISTGLLSWRARIEEQALSETLPSYQEYCKTTKTLI